LHPIYYWNSMIKNIFYKIWINFLLIEIYATFFIFCTQNLFWHHHHLFALKFSVEVHSQNMVFSFKYGQRVFWFKTHVRTTQNFVMLLQQFYNLHLKNMLKFVYFYGPKLIWIINSISMYKKMETICVVSFWLFYG